jgi:hypothetical protein
LKRRLARSFEPILSDGNAIGRRQGCLLRLAPAWAAGQGAHASGSALALFLSVALLAHAVCGTQIVVVDGKDEKVSAESEKLLRLIWGATVPPAPTPPQPPALTGGKINGASAQPLADSTRQLSSGERGSSAAAPAIPPAGSKHTSDQGAGVTDTAALSDVGGADEGDDGDVVTGSQLTRSEAAYRINAVYEAVYGQRLQVALHDEAQIGLPARNDSGYQALLASAREMSEAVGV